MKLNRDEPDELWPTSEVPATRTPDAHGLYDDGLIPANYVINQHALGINNYEFHNTTSIGWQAYASNHHTGTLDYSGARYTDPNTGNLQVAPIESHVPNSTTFTDWYSSVVPTIAPDVDLYTQFFGQTDPFVGGNVVANTRPHIGDDNAPSSESVAQLPDGQKRTLQDEVAEVCYAVPGSASSATNKRRKRTQDELKSSQKVRTCGGACLRCYVQNARCDAGRPCPACEAQFCKARKSKGFSWTVCVSANLSDLNIFAIGVPVSKEHQDDTSGKKPQPRLDKATAMLMYQTSFGAKSGWKNIVQMEELYSMVLGYMYGHRASEVHPFILDTPNPLYSLVQLNVILLKSPLLKTGPKKNIEFLQDLRAVSAIVAFECIGSELRRGTLAAASIERQSALIVQFALLLDQVVETKSDLPGAAIAVVQREVFNDMREHLIQHLTYYLHKLMPIPLKDQLIECVLEGTNQGNLGPEFWKLLSDFLPHIPLQKPPVLKSHPNVG